TGFPWNLPGYSLAFADAPLQLASLAGAYGLSWIAVFLGALPALLFPSPLPPSLTDTNNTVSFPAELWRTREGEGQGGGWRVILGDEHNAPPHPLTPSLKGRGSILIILPFYALFALGTTWGAWRLQEADRIPEQERYVSNVKLRLVQANIAQPH